MNDLDAKKNLINTCSLIIYDISYLIWLREISHNVLEDRSDGIVLYSSNDESALEIYKVFRKQLKNLQKYSTLISQFREIEKFIEDIEDNLCNGDITINSDIFQQIIREVTILKKCKYYSRKMGSIMNRVMSQRNPITASMINSFSEDNYHFQKKELVEIVNMDSRIKWKIRIQNRKTMFISPLLLKIHSDNAEQKIVDRLICRMKDVSLKIFDRYLNFVFDETKETQQNLEFNGTIFSRIKTLREQIAREPNIDVIQVERNLKSIEQIHTMIESWDFQKIEVIRPEQMSAKSKMCSRHKLIFQIDVCNKNISNEDRVELMNLRSYASPVEGRNVYSPY